MALSANQEKKEKQLANLRPRKKGDPPLPNSGRPRNTPITDALRELFSDPKELSAFVRAASKHAKRGSGIHFKEITERIDGKVVDQVEITGAVDLVERLTAARKRVKRDG